MIKFLADVWMLYRERAGFFLQLTGEHLSLSATVIAISTILGLLIGIYISQNQRSAKWVISIINIIYTIPSVAMFGLLIPLIGIGVKNAVVALSLYALLPIVRNTYIGISHVDEEIIEAARGMGSTETQMLIRIKLPLALPVIFGGFRTMVVMTIALAAIASFIGADGLGKAIWRGITTSFFEMTFAGSLIIAMLAGVTDTVLGMIEKALSNKILGRMEKEDFAHE